MHDKPDKLLLEFSFFVLSGCQFFGDFLANPFPKKLVSEKCVTEWHRLTLSSDD